MKTSNDKTKLSKFESEKEEADFKSKRKASSCRSNTGKRANQKSSGNGKLSSGSRDNDPSWYTAYPGIYSATANINFNQPAGVKLDLTDKSGTVYDPVANFDVPNIMAFHIIFTPGVTTDASSIINTAMFQNYNFVRHANSGSKNYDAVDLQMYYLGVTEAFALLWHGIRAYGILNAYSAINRSLPRVLFTALGLDFNTWKDNPAQLRARLNLAATKLGSLCIPNNARLFARMQYLMSNLFMDGDNIKSQMYCFLPEGIHTWGRVSNVGKLTYTQLGANLTVDAYFDLLDSVLQPMLEDEDINIMSGDVLKAYGTTGLAPVPMVPELYSTPIITSKENPMMMSQIENATWCAIDNLDISQNTTGHIVFNPYVSNPETDVIMVLSGLKPFLNSRNAEVTNDEIMELTRLVAAYDSTPGDDATHNNLVIRACGTELIDKVMIHKFSNGELTSERLGKVYSSLASVPAMYFQFDWAPIIYVGTAFKQGEKLNIALNRVLGDVSNYTAISKVTLSLIHDTAVASEFLLDQPKASTKY